MVFVLLTERNNGPTKLFRVRRRECRFVYFAPLRELAQDAAAISNEFMPYTAVTGGPIPAFASICCTLESKCRNKKDH
jgi:hypothetical protein